MKKILLFISIILIVSSCVSKKDYVKLEAENAKTKDELVAVKNSLTKCLIEKEKYENDAKTLENTVTDLKEDKKKNLRIRR